MTSTSLLVVSVLLILAGAVPLVLGELKPEGKARFILKGIGYPIVIVGILGVVMVLGLLISSEPVQIQ